MKHKIETIMAVRVEHKIDTVIPIQMKHWEYRGRKQLHYPNRKFLFCIQR